VNFYLPALRALSHLLNFILTSVNIKPFTEVLPALSTQNHLLNFFGTNIRHFYVSGYFLYHRTAGQNPWPLRAPKGPEQPQSASSPTKILLNMFFIHIDYGFLCEIGH
jgi:hypothetical protein